MKILVADDTEVMLLLVSRFVESLGHISCKARDGIEAIEVFEREQPDMILMDVMMPRMNGIDASYAIKQKAGKRWVPILYVSAVGDEAQLADALERGGDDYLVKPVNFRILEAKLKAIQRSVELHQTVLEQSDKLAIYFDRAEEEKKVARHLMEQLVNVERLSDPQVQYWLNSAESLSGDLIAVARTPGRVLHVLLADGIGHGLTAALSVLPLTQPFYAMTEKGFSITAILREMNTKVRQVLPYGRFVSMAMLAIDQVNLRIDVWNGGIPPVLLFNREGEEIERFPSRNVPLGILDTAHFDHECSSITLSSEGTLTLFSDGLIEAYNAQDEVFGIDRVIELVAKGQASDALKSLMQGYGEFMKTTANHDDISVVLIDVSPKLSEELGPQTLVAPPLKKQDFSSPGVEREWSLSMLFGVNELRHLNVVPMLMGVIDQLPDLTQDQSAIFIILSELFNNALDHGLLRLGSKIKEQINGMDEYLLERARRLQQLNTGQISLQLEGLRQDGVFFLRVEVIDTGPGFDISGVSQSLQNNELAHGRGINLIKSLCQQVTYNESGNQATVYYVPQSLQLIPEITLGTAVESYSHSGAVK